jgi:hypothetical protein
MRHSVLLCLFLLCCSCPAVAQEQETNNYQDPAACSSCWLGTGHSLAHHNAMTQKGCISFDGNLIADAGRKLLRPCVFRGVLL